MSQSMFESSPPGWMPDKKAERILFQTYWSPQGWRRQPATLPEDFAYARQAGYMFDPVRISHDETIARLLDVRSRLDPCDVAAAFADSLATRRLDLRSALGSYGAVLRLSEHGFAREAGNAHCKICKGYQTDKSEDLNILNFERFKWGGVRHSQPLYALFDLSRFEIADRRRNPQQSELLVRILDTAANAPSDCRPNGLVKLIAPFVPGSDAQRRTMIDCLGYAGILQPKPYPGFFDGYPTYREYPGSKNDWAYPAVWWRGADGINLKAVSFYFPNLKV